jgi:hypothetical protein
MSISLEKSAIFSPKTQKVNSAKGHTLEFEAYETPLYSPLVVQATPKVGRGANSEGGAHPRGAENPQRPTPRGPTRARGAISLRMSQSLTSPSIHHLLPHTD